MTIIAERPPIAFPPGFDPDAILAPLRHSAVLEQDGWTRGGAAVRTAITRYDPLLFMLLYLSDYMANQRTGEINIARGHLAILEVVAQWADPVREAGDPHHDAMCAPRRYGKSTLTSFGGALWALCHGHRDFFVMFSETVQLAVTNHVARIAQLLKGDTPAGQQLLRDFPHMRPLPGGGAQRINLAGGQTIAAGGIGGNTLGLVAGTDRPDLMVFDDMLPGARVSPENVAKIRRTITESLLPMGAGHCAVLLSGTVFAPYDLIHDVVMHAIGRKPVSADRGRWLTANRFVCHYFRPDWPSAWPPAQLAARRVADARGYAIEFEPHLLLASEGSNYWTDELFAQRRWAGYTPIRRVIFTDHASSERARSDFSAIVVLALIEVNGAPRVVVEWAEAEQYDLDSLSLRIHQLHDQFAGFVRPNVVGWETNQGGDKLAQAMVRIRPLPYNCTLVPFRVSVPKDERIKDLHGRYKSGDVYHARELEDFETQAVAWRPGASGPGVDDMLDAVSAGVRELLDGDPGDTALRARLNRR